MSDAEKTRAQLLDELVALRRRAAEWEDRGAAYQRQQILLDAFHQIGQITSSSLDVDQILDRLAEQIIVSGTFRSLMVAVVEEETHSVKVARHVNGQDAEGQILPRPLVHRPDALGLVYGLDDDNITAQVARTGQMQVIEEWDERLDPRFDTPDSRRGQVAYFIPVRHGERVLAVVGTGSQIGEKEEVLRRIEAMQPLLDQVAISLEHARLYQDLQRDIIARQQAEQTLRESEERYRALVEMPLHLAVMLLAPDGRYLYASPQVRARDEISGSTSLFL